MFASRVKGLKASGIREIFNLACSMEGCINLSIGQADFDVPAPLKAAAARAIQEGFNRYTVTGGIPDLREGILRQVRARWGVEAEASLITAGVSGGLVLAFLTLIEPGDEVLIPDPYFVLYRALVELCGGIPVFYDTYPDFKPRREELESKISGKTKLILINSPQNPTGVCYDRTDLQTVADVAGKRDLLVISDEIYWRFSYDSPALSMLQFYPKTLMLSGFSKSFAMPGWRMGYAVGPKAILDTMETLQQFTFVCPPAPFQKACAEELDTDVSHHVDEYRRKRDFVYEGLREHFDVVRPGGAFYMFAKVPNGGETGTGLVRALVAQKLLLVPGAAFSRRDTHFRLSFAASDEDLRAGIKLLGEMALQHA
jgi:aspartate aminotransferase/aminotransferase